MRSRGRLDGLGARHQHHSPVSGLPLAEAPDKNLRTREAAVDFQSEHRAGLTFRTGHAQSAVPSQHLLGGGYHGMWLIAAVFLRERGAFLAGNKGRIKRSKVGGGSERGKAILLFGL